MSDEQWIKKAAALMDEADDAGPVYVEVRHSNWCGKRFGIGRCICTPDVRRSTAEAYGAAWVQAQSNRAARRARDRSSRRRGGR
jgi:hypothetical protein